MIDFSTSTSWFVTFCCTGESSGNRLIQVGNLMHLVGLYSVLII